MKTPKLIVALDPGGTTGIAWWHSAKDEWGQLQIGPCNEDGKLKELMSCLSGITTLAEPFVAGTNVVVLCESFDFRMNERYRDKIDYTAAEVIGALRYWATMHDCHKLILKGASLGKGFWTDERIKTLGLWVSGARHAMDATRHLLRYRSFELNDQSLFERFRPVQDPLPL